jgi:hypothetical protein
MKGLSDWEANYRKLKGECMKSSQLVRKSFGLLAGILLTQGAAANTPDHSTAKGTVLVVAPTALNGPTNQGVWFVNPTTKAFSLDLPALAANQVYEGWIIDNYTGKKTSTGLFRSNGGIDSDAAGRYAGPLSLNFPPVPGSDFVTLGQDLVDGGHDIVITIEPYPDSDPTPSGVAVLKVNIPADTEAGTELTLESIAQ